MRANVSPAPLSETSQLPFSLLAIVVLYRRLPHESPALTTLLEAIHEANVPALRIRIVVADNTPGGQQPGPLADDVGYRAYPTNPGLAVPYNEAIDTARSEGFDWLLTLDQDTHLPANFLSTMIQTAMSHADDKSVAAVVPW